MRRIELLTPRLQTDDATKLGTEYPYARLILENARRPLEKGFSVQQIEQALAVVTAVQRAEADGAGHILLEEADWAYLNQRVSEGGWMLVDPLIPAFVRAIQNAPKVEAAERPAERAGGSRRAR